MQLNSSIYLFNNAIDLDSLYKEQALSPFDKNICTMLSDVSSMLLKDARAKRFPDVITFAFWCRRANIETIIKKYSFKNRLGRGIVFHITPSNVPVNFAYSLVAGLLAGNINIVRVPSKSFEQVDIITNAFKTILNQTDYRNLKNRVILLRYERDTEITRYLSSLCDVRIIWGGDNAISDIRKAPLTAKAFDVTFADRYSICIIGAREYILESNKSKVALDFYNDTYLFDQNACTSPHLIVWLGSEEEILTSKKLFWEELHTITKKMYSLQPVQSVDKLTAAYKVAINRTSQIEESIDNYITRVSISEIENGIEEMRCLGGFFLEYSTNSLEDICKIITRKYQTFAYYGVSKDDLFTLIINNNLNGIDRVVPIGKTTDFSLTWDGYDLVYSLSRVIDCI